MIYQELSTEIGFFLTKWHEKSCGMHFVLAYIEKK